MVVGTRTATPDAQEAVVLARFDAQAAMENVERIIRTDYMAQALDRIIDGLTAKADQPADCDRCDRDRCMVSHDVGSCGLCPSQGHWKLFG